MKKHAWDRDAVWRWIGENMDGHVEDQTVIAGNHNVYLLNFEPAGIPGIPDQFGAPMWAVAEVIPGDALPWGHLFNDGASARAYWREVTMDTREASTVTAGMEPDGALVAELDHDRGAALALIQKIEDACKREGWCSSRDAFTYDNGSEFTFYDNFGGFLVQGSLSLSGGIHTPKFRDIAEALERLGFYQEDNRGDPEFVASASPRTVVVVRPRWYGGDSPQSLTILITQRASWVPKVFPEEDLSEYDARDALASWWTGESKDLGDAVELYHDWRVMREGPAEEEPQTQLDLASAEPVTFDTLRRAFPKLTAVQAEDLVDDIDEVAGLEDAEASLAFADRLLGGAGIRPVSLPHVAAKGPQQAPQALLVDMGSDDDPTVLYEVESGRWYITSVEALTAPQVKIAAAHEARFYEEDGRITVELYNAAGLYNTITASDMEEAEIVAQRWVLEGVPTGGDWLLPRRASAKRRVVYQGAVYVLAGAGDWEIEYWVDNLKSGYYPNAEFLRKDTAFLKAVKQYFGFDQMPDKESKALNDKVLDVMNFVTTNFMGALAEPFFKMAKLPNPKAVLSLSQHGVDPKLMNDAVARLMAALFLDAMGESGANYVAKAKDEIEEWAASYGELSAQVDKVKTLDGVKLIQALTSSVDKMTRKMKAKVDSTVTKLKAKSDKVLERSKGEEAPAPAAEGQDDEAVDQKAASIIYRGAVYRLAHRLRPTIRRKAYRRDE